ncbi:gephyrin-like molybdotransferase receptor GlpR [Nocardia sp. CDC153]|uniref:divisome protein SepX/GlpR n=1 Tax=Nocardia sp. CDC153 TaxID=3112167 RepID=UPI002DB879DD|nr:gephyrin-like molybdotransferase receptor GlpR [Nocardia sp. CDC153]MEC3951800.1 gephyrin-like molybdotransferase receptor GlpR [Nocardia sp. CDC153]
MPNSILWIGLVVLWVFVLFPMLANRHPRIRQHTDAALSTRVLHRGGAKRRTRKGPATGHETDPDYVPVRRKLQHPSEDPEDRMTRSDDSPAASDEKDVETEGFSDEAQVSAEAHESEGDSAEGAGETPDSTESDSETVESESESETVTAEHESEPEEIEEEPEPIAAEDEPIAAKTEPAAPKTEAPRRASLPALRAPDPEPEPETDSEDEDFVPSRRGRGGFDPEADAAARAARYTFRQRASLGLVLATLILAAAGFAISPALWWLCAVSGTALVAYLAYLRRQVRIEADIRRRRAARTVRRRTDEAEAAAPARERQRPDREQTRTQLRRAVLVEPDDEDPLFEHLELFDAAEARATRQRATGARERRAVGE